MSKREIQYTETDSHKEIISFLWLSRLELGLFVFAFFGWQTTLYGTVDRILSKKNICSMSHRQKVVWECARPRYLWVLSYWTLSTFPTDRLGENMKFSRPVLRQWNLFFILGGGVPWRVVKRVWRYFLTARSSQVSSKDRHMHRPRGSAE